MTIPSPTRIDEYRKCPYCHSEMKYDSVRRIQVCIRICQHRECKFCNEPIQFIGILSRKWQDHSGITHCYTDHQTHRRKGHRPK